MLEIINTTLLPLRACFTRTSTFNWMVITVLGFIVREDTLGVTSIIRALLLPSQCYTNLINFFHSEGWIYSKFYEVWWKTVLQKDIIQTYNDKLVILGDHTNVSKDGRQMPAVRAVKQDSETSSKPSFFRGHRWGFISLLIGNSEKEASIPLLGEIHQKVEVVGVKENKLPITERIVTMAQRFSNHVQQDTLLILDRFFSVKSVFNTAYENTTSFNVTILTLAKKSYVAYRKPERIQGQKKKIYGEKIILFNLFPTLTNLTEKVSVYGKEETAIIYSKILLWKPIGRELLFIWADTSHGKIILMSSDLTLDPISAVELYCKRIKIESLFSVFKNLLGGFNYHFWSKHLQPQSRNPKKQKKVKLKSSDAASITLKIAAIERFVALQVVAMGILQIVAFKYSKEVLKKGNFWMRTVSSKTPSERIAKKAIYHTILNALLKKRQIAIIHIINQKQNCDYKIDN